MSNVVLIIDDDPLASTALRNSISKVDGNLELKLAASSEEGLKLATNYNPAVAIVDLTLNPRIGPESGLNLISDLLKLDSTIRVIVLTSHESSEFGIKALHRGAGSFIEKPANTEHLVALINDAKNFCNLKRDYIKNQTSHSVLGIKTSSKKMAEMLELANFAASNNRPILILGETGTGKSMLARKIHNNKGNFLRLQPSFTNSDLVSSELFGHERGAFTGANTERKGLLEEADQGTLFIDEVDELPKETQVSLLNVLQEKTFRRLGSNKEKKSNFRLITASNICKTELMTFEKLRQDFFHRIAHGIIEIPALRERKEDIPYLSRQFLQNLSDTENLSVEDISDSALSSLSNHDWPGNIRELQAVIEGGAYKASYKNKRFIDIEDFELDGIKNKEDLSFRNKIRDYELKLVLDALSHCEDNQTKAAELLQLDRTSLRRILNRKT